MLGIFEDEWHETGPISSNLIETPHLLPLDVALSGLKGGTLHHHSMLTSGKRCDASTTPHSVSRS